MCFQIFDLVKTLVLLNLFEGVSLCKDYDEKVDKPFTNKYEKLIDEISVMRSEEITIKNNLGITQTIKGRNGESYKIEKELISFDDILGYGDIGKIIKENYEDYLEVIKKVKI